MTFAKTGREDKMPTDEVPLPVGFGAAQPPRPPANQNPRPARPMVVKPGAAVPLVAEKAKENRPVPESVIPEEVSSKAEPAPIEKPSFAERLPQVDRKARLVGLCEKLEATSSAQARLEVTTRMLKMLTPNDFKDLAFQNCADERKPARMALDYIGEKDVSWIKVQSVLERGKVFVKDIIDMDGETYLTWKSLHHMKEYGDLNPAGLACRNPVAHVLALHFDACMTAAQERLIEMGPAPRVIEEPPSWPLEIDIEGVQEAVLEAARWGKTALLICNGVAREVDAYFASRDSICIHAKWILEGKVVADMQQELHALMIRGLVGGQPLHFAMRDAAVPFRDTYCNESVFPKAVFNNKNFTLLQEQGRRLFLPGDPVSETELCVSRARPECYTFVTTDLDVKAANERLSSVLPYFEDMAIVKVSWG